MARLLPLVAAGLSLLVSLPSLADPTATPAGTRVSFTQTYTIVPKGRTEKAILTVVVPRTIEGKQKLHSLKYSFKPERVFEEKGVHYARFVAVQPRNPVTIRIDADVELFRHDLGVAQRRGKRVEDKNDLKQWLVQEKFIEKDAPEIQEIARKLPGKSDLATLQAIMAFVHQTVKYSGFDATDRGALWALTKGKGDCTEFCDLFVALCRAKNIPARIWEGYLTTEIKPGDTHKHSRVEVYTREFGWVIFDPLHAVRGGAKFESTPANLIYLSCRRNDPVLNNFHEFSYRYFGDKIEVKEEFTLQRPKQAKAVR